MYQHILIPTDGSELSKMAIREGIALAKALGASIRRHAIVTLARGRHASKRACRLKVKTGHRLSGRDSAIRPSTVQRDRRQFSRMQADP